MISESEDDSQFFQMIDIRDIKGFLSTPNTEASHPRLQLLLLFLLDEPTVRLV
jgi:hypothetical protein